MAEKCKCPMLDGVDSYFAGLLETDLDVDRSECPGGQDNELGQLVCNALLAKEQRYAEMMKPVGDAMEDYLRNNTDGVE